MDFSAYHFTLIIVALITGVLSPLTLQVFQYFSKKIEKKEKHSLSNYKTFKSEGVIIKKLESIRDEYNCDRVWIAEFHNGSDTYSGRSFQKFSLTYEVVKHGIAAEANITQNIPTSVFSNFFQTLSEKGHYEAYDTKKAQDVSAFTMQSFWSSRGIISYAAIAIKDLNNNFVGILCLDGVTNKIYLNKEEVTNLMIIASSISGYLSNEKNKKNGNVN